MSFSSLASRVSLILLVAFNASALIVSAFFAYSITGWLALGVFNFSALLVWANQKAKRGDHVVFGVPLATVGFVYLLTLALAFVGVSFLLFIFIPFYAVIAIALSALYWVASLSISFVHKRVAPEIKTERDAVKFVQNAIADLKSAKGRANQTVGASIDKAIEQLQYTAVQSNDATVKLETDIKSVVAQINAEVEQLSETESLALAAKLTKLLADRAEVIRRES